MAHWFIEMIGSRTSKKQYGTYVIHELVKQPGCYVDLEAEIDLLAKELNIDPVELRRRNILKQGDVVWTPIVNLDTEVSLPTLLDKATKMAGELKKSSQPNILTGRGCFLCHAFFRYRQFAGTRFHWRRSWCATLP